MKWAVTNNGVPPQAGSGSRASHGADQSSPPKASIPNAAQVADAVRWLGGRTSAVALCTILEIRGFERANAQLGMQRATDTGEVRVNDDWTLSA